MSNRRTRPKKRAANFTSTRIPKFLSYFERILKQNARGGDFIFGKKAAYVDLSLFQMIEGLRYAFPKTMARLEPEHPRKAFSATIPSWKRSRRKTRPPFTLVRIQTQARPYEWLPYEMAHLL